MAWLAVDSDGTFMVHNLLEKELVLCRALSVYIFQKAV